MSDYQAGRGRISVMGKKADGGRAFRGGGDEKPKGSNLIIMASV